MSFLFVINIFIYFYLQFIKLRYLSSYFKNRKFAGTNPFIILFIFKLPVDIFKVVIGPPFILESGIDNIYYNIAILITSVSLLVDYLLLRFAFLVSNKYTFTSYNLNIKTRYSKMIYASIVFYFLFFLSFFLLSSSSFGFLNWIKDPRTGYQLHRMGAGQFWVFAISFLSVSFTIFAFSVKKNINLIMLLVPYLYSAYLLGSKGIVLEFLVFFLIVLWIRRFKNLRKIFLITVPLAFLLMIINFFTSAGYNSGTMDYKSILSYFDYYVNSAMYYKEYYAGGIDLFYGKIYFSEFWSLVPRGFYPNKPYIYGIIHVNEYFFPGAAEATNTPAFGGPVNYFADFGILGVVVLTFLDPFKFIYYFFLCQLLKSYDYESIKNNLFLFLLFLFFTAPFFLFSLSFPLNMIFLFMVAMILLFMNKIRFSK
ncbi:O-antigen polymerase [Flavobacterium agrisoli]|uniref:Oligosaccharide repeat unit polymerase n=1 Tax=Flavobacterium agrisoli TaxID=2793066 RepID=A0A934UKS4_9FLAO|nr:O-antigen polymerase [Flavobacterium agrisoli]MBK0371267.1 oligosaccharide repeat unit polymerase [Flavobacterium agrisoli]